jgi:hypothetical protein
VVGFHYLHVIPLSSLNQATPLPDEDRIISKTYMTRVEGENTRLRHYLARLHRKTLCYSKSVEMLRHSIKLLIHYLRWGDVPVPFRQPLS